MCRFKLSGKGSSPVTKFKRCKIGVDDNHILITNKMFKIMNNTDNFNNYKNLKMCERS